MAAIFFGISAFCAQAQPGTLPDVNELLRPSPEDLMNIKPVTTSGYSQTTAEAPSTTQLLTSKQNKENGYEQLEDSLKCTPGIDRYNRGFSLYFHLPF